jgi:hypothetical protein
VEKKAPRVVGDTRRFRFIPHFIPACLSLTRILARFFATNFLATYEANNLSFARAFLHVGFPIFTLSTDEAFAHTTALTAREAITAVSNDLTNETAA